MRAFKHAYSPRNSSSRVLSQGRRPLPSPAGSALRRATLWVPESLDKRLYDFNFTQAAASAGQLTPLAKPPVAAANESRSKESRPPPALLERRLALGRERCVEVGMKLDRCDCEGRIKAGLPQHAQRLQRDRIE
jgi:hypothetical protein